MITINIKGIKQLTDKLERVIEKPPLKRIVSNAADPIVESIKSNYISRQHSKTGALVNSIQKFARRDKGKNDFFITYYVGPKYNTGNSDSKGGNAAHLLEYGTVERYRADVANGGVGRKGTGLSRVYGAKLKTGMVKKPTIGVIRLSFEQTRTQTSNTLKDQFLLYLQRRKQQLKL